MRVNCINNETRDFLGAQQNHVCCKKLKRLRKQWIAPLAVTNSNKGFENSNPYPSTNIDCKLLYYIRVIPIFIL